MYSSLIPLSPNPLSSPTLSTIELPPFLQLAWAAIPPLYRIIFLIVPFLLRASLVSLYISFFLSLSLPNEFLSLFIQVLASVSLYIFLSSLALSLSHLKENFIGKFFLAIFLYRTKLTYKKLLSTLIKGLIHIFIHSYYLEIRSNSSFSIKNLF